MLALLCSLNCFALYNRGVKWREERCISSSTSSAVMARAIDFRQKQENWLPLSRMNDRKEYPLKDSYKNRRQKHLKNKN